MRELWIKVPKTLTEEEKQKLLERTSNITSAFIVEPDDEDLVRKFGAKIIISPSGSADIVLVRDLKDISKTKNEGKKACVIVTVKSKRDERRIIAAAEATADYVVAVCPDWKVIPLENLIAELHGKSELFAFVSDFQEARTALETLEIGVDGVVVELSDVDEIMKIHEIMKSVKTRVSEIETTEKITLLPAKVTEVKPLGSGARVCIDTCDLMKAGEGLLVGCQSSGLFLIEGEVHETPFVAPRPFRVNAGSIALYVLVPGSKTRYLSELKAGDEVLIVDHQGRSRMTNICRVKIEWRPLSLIEAEYEGKKIKTIVQNAETIRIMTEDGSKSVKNLTSGDKVLVHLEEGGRHFGVSVKQEKVIEK